MTVTWGQSQVALVLTARCPRLVRGLIIGDAPVSVGVQRAHMQASREMTTRWRALAASDAGVDVEELAAQLRRLMIRHPATGELVGATEVFAEDHIWFREVARSLVGHDPYFLDAVQDRFDDAFGELVPSRLFPRYQCPVLLVQGDPAAGACSPTRMSRLSCPCMTRSRSTTCTVWATGCSFGPRRPSPKRSSRFSPSCCASRHHAVDAAGICACDVAQSACDERYSGGLDVLEQTWQVWAELGDGLAEDQWSAATRCPGWDVAALYAHHSAFPWDLDAPLPLLAMVGEPVTAGELLRRFNAPDGLAHTMADTAADLAVSDTAAHTRKELIDRFSVHGPYALKRLRHAEATLIVPWPTSGALITLVEAIRIVILEATVHLLTYSVL